MINVDIRDVMNVGSEQELLELAERLKFRYYTNYAKERDAKILQFKQGIEAINASLEGKLFLDLGPGTCDALDAARDMGAARCTCVD